MNVRSKMTNKGEVAISQGTTKHFAPSTRRYRHCASSGARQEIASGTPLIPKEIVDKIIAGKNAFRAIRKWRGKKQHYISSKINLGQATFPTWKADGEKVQSRL